MSKKIKMLVGNHLNAGARVNHDRRVLTKQLRQSSRKIKLPQNNSWGHDGIMLGKNTD